jgi:2,4-dichlorophenol 6-monooxygenase
VACLQLYSLLKIKIKLHQIHLLERHSHRLGQPKAHAINPRSLEIFRQVGLDTAKIWSLGSSADDTFWVRVVTLLTGFQIGKLPYERQDEAVKELTPEPLCNISQPLLEQYLQQAAIETGLVGIHRRWEWKESLFQADGKPVSRVVNRDNTEEVIDIISDDVIGADGTDSQVRTKTLGI